MAGTDNAQNLEFLQIQSIMSTENGRAFMYRLLARSGIFSDGFDKDPLMLARLSGRRSMGIELQNALKEATPERYVTMITENMRDG